MPPTKPSISRSEVRATRTTYFSTLNRTYIHTKDVELSFIDNILSHVTQQNIFLQTQILLQSIVVFSGWLLAVVAFILFVPALFVITVNPVLGWSTVLTLASLFVLGMLTIRERHWNYVGWASLTASLTTLVLTVPNGGQLVYLTIGAGLITTCSFLGFADGKALTPLAWVVGALMLAVFSLNIFIICNPRNSGLDTREDFISIVAQHVAMMDPVDFSKTHAGKDLATEVYNVPSFISDQKLESIIRNNPGPLERAQHSLLSNLSTIAPMNNNPYRHIINVYAATFIKDN